MDTSRVCDFVPLRLELIGYLSLTSFLGFSANVSSFIYIQRYLKVSVHIKRILRAEACFVLLGLCLHTSGYLLVNDSSWRNLACSWMIEVYPVTFYSVIFSSHLLATVRYYMADRTGRNLMVDHAKIRLHSRLAIIVWSGAMTAAFIASVLYGMKISPLTSVCAKRDFSNVTPVSHCLIIVCLIVSTVYQDNALKNFIRRQNRAQPVRMAAWSVIPIRSSNRLEDQLKDTVPIISTMISFACFLFGVLTMVLMKIIRDVGSFEKTQFIVGIPPLVLWTHLPVILIFTVKSQKKKNAVRPMPPSELQYHDVESSL